MENNNTPESSEEIVEQRGIVSNQLSEDGITNESLGNDHIGVEIISVKPEKLMHYIKSIFSFFLQIQNFFTSTKEDIEKELNIQELKQDIHNENRMKELEKDE